MRNDLYYYISANFKPGEPFFYEDLAVPSSRDSVRHQIARLLREGKIQKYKNGTFYLPKKSLLGLPPVLSTERVAVSKYIKRREKIIGFYSGQTFANQIGISLQVPVVKEIVTNESSAIVRSVQFNNRKFQIRKTKVPIDNDNYKILQLLSLLEKYDKYTDHEVAYADEKIRDYARANDITREKLYQYAGYYNSKALRFIQKVGL